MSKSYDSWFLATGIKYLLNRIPQNLWACFLKIKFPSCNEKKLKQLNVLILQNLKKKTIKIFQEWQCENLYSPIVFLKATVLEYKDFPDIIFNGRTAHLGSYNPFPREFKSQITSWSYSSIDYQEHFFTKHLLLTAFFTTLDLYLLNLIEF